MAVFRIILVIILVAACIMVLDWTKPETKADLKSLPVNRVKVTQVQQRDITPSTLLTGKIQPAMRADLRFELSGQIADRYIEPGQQVVKDDILLTMDDGDYQDRYQEAIAELELEKANVERDRQQLKLIREEIAIQQREVKRLEQLGQKSLASKSNYDTALKTVLQLKSEESRLRSSVNASGSKLQLRESKVNMARRNLERTRLRAPFNATVNQVQYDIGDYARSGEVAVELVQLDEMDLYLDVTGTLMSTLSVGQTIDMKIRAEDHQGKIISIEPDPDADTMTHAIHVRLPGDGLYSGQLAQAILPSEQLTQVSVVPLSAILYEQGESYVYRIDSENRLQRVAVTLLARQEESQAIAGISPGETIVARDVTSLTEGQEVSIE